MGANHAHIQGVVRRQQRNAHHGLDHGNVIAFNEGPQFLFGVGEPHAAARANQRLLRLSNRLDDAPDLQVVSLDGRAIAPNIHGFGIRKFLQFLFLYVAGNVNQDRTRTPRRGDMKRFFHNARQFVRVLDKIAVFRKGRGGSGYVHFLKDVASEKAAGDLSGNGDHGYGIHVGRGDSGQKVRRARTGCHHAHAHFSAHAGVARRHMPGVLLRADQRVADFGRG